MMTAFIIDDEQHSLDTLHLLLLKYCKNVKVIGLSSNFQDAIEKVDDLKPQILFLDVNLQNHTGFDVLTTISHKPAVIFTTAYDHFAIKAIKYDAIDYLLKPIDKDELIKAIQRAETKKGYLSEHTKQYPFATYIDQISVATPDGIKFLKTIDIIRLEADGGYTVFYLADNTKFIISKNLGSFDKMLEHTTCKRIHKSHIVNLSHVVRLNKATKQINMSDGSQLPIPRDKVDEFYQMMDDFLRNKP